MKNLKLVQMRQLFVVAMMGVALVGQGQAKGGKGIASTDQITLNVGWNLISLDVIPDPATPASVFAPLIANNNLEIVTGFQNQQGVMFDPTGLPFLNSLQSIVPGEGYWVKVVNAATLNVTGQPISETFSINLKAGWNLVGYWLPETTTPEEAFADLINAGVLDLVAGYNQGSQIFDPTGLSFLNSLTQIKNGFGYWVKLNADYTDFSYPVWECGHAIIDDRDGQTYGTVQIGTQCWLKQNLNIGIRIEGTSNQTDNGTIEKYCYDNLETNCDVYGGLYQWDEIMQYTITQGVQGICPQGWYLPTNAEWTTLIEYLGGFSVAGGKMKETGTTHWLSPNTGGTNSSGFTGLPGGYRSTDGTFNSLGYDGYFWSSTEYSSTYAWFRNMLYNNACVYSCEILKGYGFSVRCLRDF